MLATRLTAWLRPALTVAATAAMLALTACGGGSGAPNNPYEPPPPTPGPLVVVPAEAVAYAGTPLILSISSYPMFSLAAMLLTSGERNFPERVLLFISSDTIFSSLSS